MNDTNGRLFLLEDEENLVFSLQFNLEGEGYTVEVARNVREATAIVERGERFDLYLLDVMLPDGNGVEFCRFIREQKILAPVLFLTAKGGADAVVAGLEAGGDDYLTKPFALAELLGRVRAILRRQSWQASDESTAALTFGGNSVNFVTREVSARGDEVTLTELELRLLRYLVDNRARPVTRAELLENVWEVPGTSNTRTVDNFVVRLRRLFEADPAKPRHIVTVRGVGYRFAN